MTMAATAPDPTADPAHRFDRRLWRIDAATEAALRSLAPTVLPALDGALRDFYAFMAGLPETRSLLADAGRRERLRQLHHDQWRRFFQATFDDAYHERVRELGGVHQRVGLSPAHYMASYSYLLESMVGEAIRRNRFSRDRAAVEAGALIRTVMMEAELALSVYLRQAVDTEMATEMEEFAEGFERELGEAVDLVRRNAATMEGAADEVLGAANHVATEGDHVTEASEQTNMNARLIALAARGLSDSFAEITKRVGDATSSSSDAATLSRDAEVNAHTLAEASARIGNVVTLIERIAKETRLLALNASIEAARAGDAGRGFAVVAAEVKTLAEQTNDATGNIRSQIEQMQESIDRTVAAITAVAARIGQVSGDVAAITDSVSEQSVVTRDIADNADEMAASMQNVHERIESVAQAAERSTRKASELWENATGLVKQIFGIKRRVTASLRGTRFGNRRAQDRVAVDLSCQCVVDGLRFDSRLDNISAAGCQVRELQLASADGYRIQLDVEQLGRMTGTIVATERDVAHVRFDPLAPDLAARLERLLVDWSAADGDLKDTAQDTAAAIGRMFDHAIDRGGITVDQLFSTDYQPVPGSDPQQVTTPFVELCDRLLPAVQEPLLTRFPRAVFCAAVDRNGYLPTHNAAWSQPQRPGEPDWNAAHSRNRRMFDDATGLAAARNRQPVLVQTYRRDMGGGVVASMRDISAPIFVKGKHWGAFRIGCRA
ncbi:hypothetical protein HL658_33190 [Azospirillum sp. RWY-5-1]|uniref:Methyl-accepting transducer domain-containing protein n=1 Tax=Azospirillum oleiclasticum TaxID=2735135 RepID=A0ABX2TME9_9PROT|nr:methyl-accepting chemotaxis protein [Azospirillum oleiclasticum]NYZ17424.1 hypothetical protein [Azospirillum oleiclasticum]NYZ24801.1 hypothetical protein [Azospirillum oleiclasticum]